ncbi:MAG: transglycosylase SLT domain-containing protein [Gammaproteobacteria bacterium]|nr:transglycosylase SLT domain-containing protein [Gammaproteobacteria bacterium]
MYWTSCGPIATCHARVSRTHGRRRRARPLPALAACLLAGVAAAASAPAAAVTADRDPVLREKLRAALEEPLAFEDRFEAEVWLTDMAGRLAPKVPDPGERLEILTTVHREASRVGLPPEMILAVIDVESGFQRYAVSRANAQGLMQVMRFWLAELDMPGHALLDVQENVRMGCTILRHYYDLEKGNWTRALARYNGSVGSRAYPDRVFERLRTRWFRQ